MKKIQTPKLPFSLPVQDVGESLDILEHAIKIEPYASHLLTWKAILLQLDERGDGVKNLECAKVALQEAISINPNDIEAVIEAVHFFDVVVPNKRLVNKYVRHLKALCHTIEKTLDDLN